MNYCQQLILATKTHAQSGEEAVNLFTDADLAILGSDLERYQAYSREIRREYKWFPDCLYNPGRRKVLAHFLEMESIFKTTHFRALYETAVRRNLAWEAEPLG